MLQRGVVTVTTVCLLIGGQCFSNEQLLEIVEKGCPPDNMVCPKGDYGIFEGFNWIWNPRAITDSAFARHFRSGGRGFNIKLFYEIQNEFCCQEGPCLMRCGIRPKKEIDLVENFPMNAQDILDLNLPQLEKHREFVTEWLRTHRTDVFPSGQLPHELYSYFDSLYEFQVLVRTRLHEKGLWLR